MDLASALWLLGTIVISVAGGALGYVGVQWQHRHHLRDFERWLGDLEDRAHEVIRTDARAAGAKGELFELMGLRAPGALLWRSPGCGTWRPRGGL